MSRTPITPEQWAQVQEVFQAVITADPSRRDEILESSGAETWLREEVLSLVEAHERTGIVVEPAPKRPLPRGERIAGYSILRRLGEGGMGTVYLAERSGEGFTHNVALKVIRPGVLDQRVGARLAGERRILARLEHPGIARFIDGGQTEAGSPYVAMEYVEGTDLLGYCHSRSLDVEQRLRLFLQVCDAVQYAHQQLVVHRDIKPQNIMVTEDGRPKLLDFGIAKVLEPTTDGGVTTVPWFTPAYASPEQVLGRQVGTASDVYALGVVLYQLLSDRLPYDIPVASPVLIQQAVCEVMPPPPSERATEATVGRSLRGDLDTIVLRALAKEPERRYPTAERLADDIRRYLEGRPVLARPDTWSYRAAKFVRRHRAAAALALLLLLSLAAYGITLAGKNRRIAAALAEARYSAENAAEHNAFLLGLFEPRGADPSTDSLIVSTLVERGEQRASQVEPNPAAAILALSAVGQVHRHLGRYDEAADWLERALARSRERYGDKHLETAEVQWHLADVYRLLGRRAEAESILTAALRTFESQVGREHPRVALVINQLAVVRRDQGRLDEAERDAREALAIRRRVLDDRHPGIAASLNVLASVLRRKGELDEAEPLYREVVERMRRDYVGDHSNVAIALNNLALLQHDRGNYAAAESLYREAGGMHRRVLGDDHPFVATGMTNLGQTLTRLGKLGEAESLIRGALERRRKALGNEHPNVAVDLHNLGVMLKAAGRNAEAEQALREALALRRKLLGNDAERTRETEKELSALHPIQ